MSYRRRRRPRDHRRGKSVGDIAKEELVIIVDEDEIDPLGGIREDSEMDKEHSLSHLLTHTPSEDFVGQLIDEIDRDLAHQYPTPPAPIISPLLSTEPKLAGKRQRSDSHWRASTPLAVKKYTNYQLDYVVKNKKPQLLKANELALLTDIKDEDERRGILLKKLSLCEVLCDFRIVNGVYDDNKNDDMKILNEIQCIDNKKNMLKECTKYLTKAKWSEIYVLEQVFRTVQTNLFRSLPDSFIIAEFQGIDNPTKYTLPSWTHLQFIYELLFQVIMNANIDKEKLASYFTGSFMNNFVQLFHSLCKAEVDYIKILIHSMYLDFVPLREEIRICLSQYCWDFIYCGNGTPDGINAILDIMNSILQGLDDDKLNDPAKWYIVLCHVLCPLHKGSSFDKFEQTLYRCIKTYIKSRPEHFVVVFNHGLLKFWPKTNPAKEHTFVKEIINIIKMVKRTKFLCDTKFTNIFNCIIDQIRRNLLSKHYQIVMETIESFKDRSMRQLIEFHGGETRWEHLYKSLIYVTNNHYLINTREAGTQMLDWLKKYRITKKHLQLFQKLEEQYDNNNQDQYNNKQREDKWKPLFLLAKQNKMKLKENNKIMKTTIGDIFDSMKPSKIHQRHQEKMLAISYSYDDKSNTAFKYPLDLSPLPPPPYQCHHGMSNSQPLPHIDVTSDPKPVHPKRASEIENDYGYPSINKAYKHYVENKKIDCRTPSHLVLFAKKEGFKGVTFSDTNKYFKAREMAIAQKLTEKKKRKKKKSKKKKKKKRKPEIPTSISTAIAVATGVAPKRNVPVAITNVTPVATVNVGPYRRRKNTKSSMVSPLIEHIRTQQKIDELSLNGKRKDTGNNDVPDHRLKQMDVKDIELGILKMGEIKEDDMGNGQKYTKEDDMGFIDMGSIDMGNDEPHTKEEDDGGSMTPATPSSIKCNPQTPTSTYWASINPKKLNFSSFIANTKISLK